MIVYKTTNLINGKFYIGKDAKNKKSYLGSGSILNQAIKKYGKENFIKETLEVCNNLEHLADREIYWIEKLNAVELGYNLTNGGTGGDTITHNPNKYVAGFYKGFTPWNKGLKGAEPWNKGLKGVMSANKTSYKSGKEHIMYGSKQSEKTINKRIETRKANGSYIGVGKFSPKKIVNIEDNKIFNSIQKAADYYNISRDKVGHSCRKETKKGKFRFV
jgi:group I intron endonuclease